GQDKCDDPIFVDLTYTTGKRSHAHEEFHTLAKRRHAGIVHASRLCWFKLAAAICSLDDFVFPHDDILTSASHGKLHCSSLLGNLLGRLLGDSLLGSLLGNLLGANLLGSLLRNLLLACLLGSLLACSLLRGALLGHCYDLL